MMRRLVRLIPVLAASASLLSAHVAFGYANTPPISPDYNNRIIDDTVFTNANAMSQQDIQNFLNSMVPACDTNHQGGDPNQPPPYTCLKNYVDPTVNQTAAQIIYNQAQSVGINPEVILATLEKEEGLITDTWPYPSQYRSAMGYGCPESQSVCNAQYYGFYNQVHLGATLLRVGYDRDCGNMSSFPGWSVSSQWQQGNSPGVDGVPTFLKNCATGSFYNYTPHRPDSAYTLRNGAYYYGNYNFISYFTSWFGSTWQPQAITGPNGGTVYLVVNGYKLVVPQMAILQDYGYDPASITAVSQSVFDSIPTPQSGSGITPMIGSLVKSPSDSDADGGDIYLISEGKRYQITTLAQFNAFGFNQQNIVYLPLTYINTFPNGGALSNFVYTPTSSVFQVGGGQKQLILNYPTYQSLNPGDSSTPFSYYLANSITTGAPLTNQPTLVRTAEGGIYLYSNGAYTLVYSMDVYNCWGFGRTQSTALFQLYDDSYVPPITSAGNLGCVINDGTTNYLLNVVNKVSLPSQYGVTGTQYSADILAIANNLPTHATPLMQYIKSTSAQAVWFISGGVRRLIPTYNDFVSLGLGGGGYDVLDSSAVNAIPAAGIKLGTGSVVKASNSPTVYLINADSRITYAFADDFLAYGNNWSDIAAYSASDLNQYYPSSGTAVNRYIYNSNTSSPYLVDANGCYNLATGSLLTDYGQSLSALMSAQRFSSSLFPHLALANCVPGSNYVKQPDQALVYWIHSGTKYPFAGWNSLVNQTHNNIPTILTVSSSTLQALPTGAVIQ